MSINPHHCHWIPENLPDPATTGAEAVEEEAPLFLPPGIDETLFNRDQLEYLSDLYADTLRHHLRQFYALLRTMPPGVDITPARVGLNAAILCKLLGLTETIITTGWKSFARTLHYNKETITAQRRAMLATLKHLTRRRR